MSTRDFLERMRKAGEKFSSGNIGHIGRIKIEFGFHRYVNNHDFMSFWKPVDDENQMERVYNELLGRLQLAGSTDTPNFGIMVTVDRNVLNKEIPYDNHLTEFIAEWSTDAYNMVFDLLEEKEFPIGEWYWGQVQYRANPYKVAQGDAGKTQEYKKSDGTVEYRFPTLRVPVEIYSSKEEALAQCNVSTETEAASGWSEKAQASYGPDMERLEKLANEILAWLEKAGNGTAFNNDAESYPLPTPPTPPNLKRYIADLYAIEPSDIDMLIPF